MGMLFYRSKVNLLTGWIHHSVYVFVVEYAICTHTSHIFGLCAIMEVSAVYVAFHDRFSDGLSHPDPDVRPRAGKHRVTSSFGCHLWSLLLYDAHCLSHRSCRLPRCPTRCHWRVIRPSNHHGRHISPPRILVRRMYQGLPQASTDRGEIRSCCEAPHQHHLIARYAAFTSVP